MQSNYRKNQDWIIQWLSKLVSISKICKSHSPHKLTLEQFTAIFLLPQKTFCRFSVQGRMPFFTRPKPTQAPIEISIPEVLDTVYSYHVTASHGHVLAFRSDVQSGLC